jgi:hypothetical protein
MAGRCPECTLNYWAQYVDLPALESFKYSRGILDSTYFTRASKLLVGLEYVSLNLGSCVESEKTAKEATRSLGRGFSFPVAFSGREMLAPTIFLPAQRAQTSPIGRQSATTGMNRPGRFGRAWDLRGKRARTARTLRVHRAPQGGKSKRLPLPQGRVA